MLHEKHVFAPLPGQNRL